MAFQCEQEEVQGREIFKFSKEGDAVSGILMGLESKSVTVERDGRKRTDMAKVAVFAEVDDDGELTGAEFETLVGVDLLGKIKEDKRGHYFTIRWTESMKTGTGNTMKVFKVNCSKARLFPKGERLERDSRITDDYGDREF
jgi:hypothetical protein